MVCWCIYYEKGRRGREKASYPLSCLLTDSHGPLPGGGGYRTDFLLATGIHSYKEWKQFTAKVLFFSKLGTSSLILFSPLLYSSSLPLCQQPLCPKVLVQQDGDSINVSYVAVVCLNCLSVPIDSYKYIRSGEAQASYIKW